MITQFQLIDDNGTVLAHGEIDGNIYRVFTSESSTECQEFASLKAMYATCGGSAIQPYLFETPPRTRQLNLLGDEE